MQEHDFEHAKNGIGISPDMTQWEDHTYDSSSDEVPSGLEALFEASDQF